MPRKASRGVTSLLSLVIIVAIVLTTGIYLWSYLEGITLVKRNKLLEELNAEALVLRSAIAADYAIYPGGEAYIRNIGTEPVVIARIITYRNSTIVWDTGIREILHLQVGELGTIRFNCPGCSEDDPITLVIYYVPEALFNPDNPVEIRPLSDVEIFKVTSIKVEQPESSSGGRCPIPDGDWVWIDYVDPKEKSLSTLSNYVKLKLPKASRTDTINIKVIVTSLSDSVSTSGQATVQSESNEEVWVNTHSYGLHYPLLIHVDALTPGWQVIQRDWRLGSYRYGSRGAHIDYVKLLWNLANQHLVEAYVSVYYYRTSGWYRITVRIYDCYDELISQGSFTRYISVSGGLWEQQSILLQPHVSMFDVYRVEVEVERL